MVDGKTAAMMESSRHEEFHVVHCALLVVAKAALHDSRAVWRARHGLQPFQCGYVDEARWLSAAKKSPDYRHSCATCRHSACAESLAQSSSF
jgi:hypothetical protein